MLHLSHRPQTWQLSSYSRTISMRPASVVGQSSHMGGARFSRNSAITKSTRFVRHDHAPSGSFFDWCEARNRAKPIEITRAASRAPGSSWTLMSPPGGRAELHTVPETEHQASKNGTPIHSKRGTFDTKRSLDSREFGLASRFAVAA